MTNKKREKIVTEIHNFFVDRGYVDSMETNGHCFIVYGDMDNETYFFIELAILIKNSKNKYFNQRVNNIKNNPKLCKWLKEILNPFIEKHKIPLTDILIEDGYSTYRLNGEEYCQPNF